MFDSVEIAKNIKSCAKNKGIRLCDMLNDLGLGVNTISQLSAGKEMSFITFAKIAEYLDVSVDSLLGIDKEIQIDFYSMIPKDKTKPRIEWIEILNQLSDEDLKKMESYAAFLVSEAEKEKENPPVTIK